MAKKKVAILGGGAGALAAAFDLTEQDPDGSLYDITLYQVGWRLGGKCAVGWTSGPPKVRREHGLHIWAGFYDNAFDLLQRCYDAVDSPPFADWRDAFEPLDNCWVEEQSGGAWAAWQQHIAPNGLTPAIGQVPAPDALWTALLNLVSNAFYGSDLRETARRYLANAREGRGPAAPLTARAKEVRRRLSAEGFGLTAGKRDLLLNLLRSAQDELPPEAFVDAPAHTRHTAILVNLGLALLLGMLDGDALSEGFDGLDREEWSAWTGTYGAWEMSLGSGVVAGLYDYVFGSLNGVRQVGAGTGTRALLRLLFTYKGSFFYAPSQPFGETLIAPLYSVLLRRGVIFKFFHRVDRLLLSYDLRFVDRIEIGIQARPKLPPYNPLVCLDGTISWPMNPIYDRIEDGDTLEASGADLESPWDDRWPDVGATTLQRGADFDLVVLGISVGALGDICSDLAQRLPEWREMLGAVKTTATMAMQLWSSRSVEDYGWWPSPPTVVSALPGALTTWGDNSQFIDQEQWSDAKPASLAYFVGGFPDLQEDPSGQLAIAEAMAAAWRRTTLPTIWRDYDDGQLAIDPYVRININPSDRYVLSVPLSVESRLRPDGSGVDNLYLAGDWVRIGLNAGCVEQAVLGGRAAARAITGVDMNSQYDNDFGSGPGSVSSSIGAIGLLNLLPDIRRIENAGAGSADACCVVGYRPRAWVNSLLPLGLQVDRPLRDYPGYWPITLIFARQKDVRPGLVPPLAGLRYDEFLLVVPNVYHSDRQPFTGPFCYMPTILLDSLPPLLIGAGFYGLKKRSARIRAYPDSFDIRYDEGEISASLNNVDLPGAVQDFPQLAATRKLLEQVIIGETSSGSWVYSYLEHNLGAAEFQPISGTIRFRGLRKFQFDFFGIPSDNTIRMTTLDNGDVIPSPVGFRMLTNWAITYPFIRGQYHPSPKQASVRAFASAMTERLFPALGKFPFR